MSNLHKTTGKYLWVSLLGLGFEPEEAALSGVSKGNAKYVSLGPNMFDRPNKDAFYIVTNFLLEKLNPTRFHDEYRNCWPVLDHKADAEFRKVTCAWLKDLTDEQDSTVPKVVASLFLSPGGPKFINLIFHLTKHVMLHEMKTFSTDGSWVPKAAATPTSSMEMAFARFQLVKTRFVRGAVAQDQLLQDYQRRAWSLVKSMKDLRAENAKYEDLLKPDKEVDLVATSQAEKIQKVRSLWSCIDGVLSSVQEGRQVLECVIRGDVDQYALDGTDLHLKIPQVLLDWLEKVSHLSSVGGVYEAGQPNLLRLLELFHQAQSILGEERSRALGQTPNPQVHSSALLERNLQMGRALEDLRLMRKLISNEIPEVKTDIRRLEAEWDKKWAELLSHTPLTSFLNKDPALEFMSPMAPLSFEPATEACFKSSVFSQYPAKLSELPEKQPVKMDVSKEIVSTLDSVLKSRSPERIGSPLPNTDFSPLTTPLRALGVTPAAAPLRTASPTLLRAVAGKSCDAAYKLLAAKKRAQILDSEFDNLANQFAEAVTTSHSDVKTPGLELGDLLGTMGTDPFSTRKQIPRTPESLIHDVRSSWRKALEEDEVQKARLSGLFNNDSVLGRLTPLAEVEMLPSPDVPSLNTSLEPTAAGDCSGAAALQEDSLASTLPWDSNADVLDSLSGSDVVQFSINPEAFPEHFTLDQETLPVLPGDDSSLLSSGDSTGMSGAQEELLLPDIPYPLPTKSEPVLLDARRGLDEFWQALGNASFTSLPQRDETNLDNGDWLAAAMLETAETAGVMDGVFSLDLDTIESPLSPVKEPKLLTFSLMDNL
ncbi:hypothetical protein UPYG_G00240650 [Umbra pygmaea]|uniref:HAUS augmin-like complex subunit 6 N-terminal domain-containing protein n=1 Tax=Umbra pygmaea TaxID=75934 RepID=A0ABD0WKK0_UMBPY